MKTIRITATLSVLAALLISVMAKAPRKAAPEHMQAPELTERDYRKWDGVIGGKSASWEVAKQADLGTVLWDQDTTPEAPLSPGKAIALATEYLKPHLKIERYVVDAVRMNHVYESNNWLYLVDFHLKGPIGGVALPVCVAVKLDGTVVPITFGE